nr:DUF2382 domain-containing protein [Kineococcus siccus]
MAAEHLSVGVERVPAERVRITKRVVEELRTIEVPLRREELVITREPLSPTGRLPREVQADLVLVLHEEVPQVSVSTRAYERVTVSVETVQGQEVVQADLRTEHASVTVTETSEALRRS